MFVLKYIHNTTKTKKGKEQMDITPSQVEPVTMSEVLALASWDRPRTTQELRSFIEQREAQLTQ